MYDLLFMYKLYFNKGEWMTEFVLHKKAEQNRDFYVSIMKLFDTAPEEGALFFLCQGCRADIYGYAAI